MPFLKLFPALAADEAPPVLEKVVDTLDIDEEDERLLLLVVVELEFGDCVVVLLEEDEDEDEEDDDIELLSVVLAPLLVAAFDDEGEEIELLVLLLDVDFELVLLATGRNDAGYAPPLLLFADVDDEEAFKKFV